MTSTFGKKPFLTKWRWRLQVILWILFFALIGVFMIYVFIRESKAEGEYQKHINAEHHHSI